MTQGPSGALKAETNNASERLTRKSKRTIFAATLENLADQYDIYLPTIALATAIEYFQPANLPVATSNTIYYATFVITLLGRPIGSISVGWFADRLGRKKAIAGAMCGYTLVTLLIGLLPGFSTWGFVSLGLLLGLRFLGGVLLGGGVTSAGTLAIEASPSRLRGLVGGIIASPFTIANWLIALVTSLLLASMPISSYITWGWRIAFYIGAAGSLAVLIYFVKRVPESELWLKTAEVTKSPSNRAPLRQLFAEPQYRRTIAQTFLLMTGYWFTLNLVYSTLVPSMKHIGFKGATVSHAMLIVYVPVFLAYIGIGALNQRLGRRRSFVISGIFTIFVVPPLYFTMIATHTSLPLTIVIAAIMLCLTIGFTAPNQGVYLNERFPTAVRGVGYGLTYTAALIVPGFYSFYLDGLGRIIPYEYAHIPLIAFAGILIIVGAALGPETKGVNLDQPEVATRST